VDCTSVGHGSIPYFSTVSGIIACPFLYSVYRIVVTNGFVKKTQKTPQAELAKARKYEDKGFFCSDAGAAGEVAGDLPDCGRDPSGRRPGNGGIRWNAATGN
jgi:hypothetical protein